MSLEFNALLESVKRAAVEAVAASKPFALTYGTVTGVSPLRIMADQKLPLNEGQLILTGAVRDFTVNMTVDHTTGETQGGSGEAAFAAHSHPYSGTKSFNVHLGLKPGERVLLLRANGGQKFIVLDRVEGST